MKKFLMITAASLMGASAAYAQASLDADTDINGSVSLEEAQAVDSTVTQLDFDMYDLDADGELSMSEFAAWNADRSSATMDAEIDTDASVVTEDEAVTTESEVSTDSDADVETDIDPVPDADPELDLDMDSELDISPEPVVTPDTGADDNPILEPDMTTDLDAATEAELETRVESADPQ